MADFAPTLEQQSILDHDPDRHARVLGGPGTGKSATLVALINQLLANKPALRMLTFTRAATGELAKKVSEHPAAAAAAAERPSTIHSFAISVLLRNPGTGDFPQPLRIADNWEDNEVVRPTLARRAGVRVTRLNNLIREMAYYAFGDPTGFEPVTPVTNEAGSTDAFCWRRPSSKRWR